MPAQGATAFQATPEPSLFLVGPEARASFERFQRAIQSVLESPLDTDRVVEWTALRAIGSAG